MHRASRTRPHNYNCSPILRVVAKLSHPDPDLPSLRAPFACGADNRVSQQECRGLVTMIDQISTSDVDAPVSS